MTSSAPSGSRLSRLDFILVSGASLFVELLLIRYLSSEIRIFAYFSNLVLVTCFLGLGLGYAVTRPRLPISLSLGATFSVVLCCQPWTSRFIPFREISELLVFSDLNTWSLGHADLGRGSLGVLLLLILLVQVAVVFVPLGQALGEAFEDAPRSRRLGLYSVNVAASLAGILAFQAVSAWWLPPAAWLTIGLGLLLFVLRRRPVELVVGVVMVSASAWLATPAERPDRRILWSPYQKLELEPLHHVHLVPGGEPEVTPFFALTVNSTIYQYLLDFRPQTIATRPATFPPDDVPYFYYEAPYRLVPGPRSVLVVGSGTGNDVAAALRNGAEHIDAVEIDPAILEIGRHLHAENPYGDPRVRAVVGDARAFFHRSDRRYDLILFGLLDSHRLTSNFSNTSLDSYVYTLESFEAARRLLREDGVMIVSFQIARTFLAHRLRQTLEAVFSQAPLVLHFPSRYPVQGTGGTAFVSGDLERVRRALKLSPRLSDRQWELEPWQGPPIEPATDDWPYLYVESRSVPILWRIVSVAVLLGTLATLVPIGLRARRLDGCFFSLGFAFMLLETYAISRFALAFGATWTVSAAVIAGILVMILAGNAVVARTSVRLSWWMFGVLAVLAALAAWVPMDRLAAAPPVIRVLALGTTVVPLFFAAIAFARAFTAAPDPRAAMLSNLLGAVAGGLAQSLSFVTGQSALVGLVIAAYAVAWALGVERKETPDTLAETA